MRIAIIAHLKYAISEPFAGGLEMHTHMLTRALRDRGHVVTLFASDASDQALGVEAICEQTSLLETGVAEANDVAFFREHHAYLRLMTELRGRTFDVIHNNSLHYLPVSMADTLATRMITTLHTPPFCWLESGIRLNRARMHYVAVSEATAGMWSHVARIDEVIPNGIDLTHFPYCPILERDSYLVWYGRIVPEKGLDLAIDAARRAGLPLRIAGPISNPGYFEKAIAPRLGSDAIYVGHLDHVALARLVGGAAAALCTPRWEEPYGLVVAEALACGTPVAAFRRGGVPALLDEHCGALAAPDDVAELAAAICVAATLDRAACRARAERHCDAQRMVDAYETLYRRLAREWTLPDPFVQDPAAVASVA
ncbi:glycosyltransferase [Stakelama sp. CBK3Z-3]|uniref:Glycosyltransferase n=1 Tax=Stakelama flava TaxID=2860338 RepID=A0ABS6XPR8_9SPHN|nr:glycosyltransferase [Stakelama flava]MBW4332210.1 glycosyltransferase [Stakelama flava]